MAEYEVINHNTDWGLLKDVAQAKKAVFEYIEQFTTNIGLIQQMIIFHLLSLKSRNSRNREKKQD
jgi:hypothetical protein